MLQRQGPWRGTSLPCSPGVQLWHCSFGSLLSCDVKAKVLPAGGTTGSQSRVGGGDADQSLLCSKVKCLQEKGLGQRKTGNLVC